MNDKLKDSLARFINAFELVFDKDWAYTKEMLGVVDETQEQAENAKTLGIETIHTISPNGTFINPKIDDEARDWGYRGELLSTYRELKKDLEEI